MLAACLPAALLVGCFRPSNPDYPCTNLGGTVTVDGVPIAEGSITFLAQNEPGVTTPIARGRYIADKVPLAKVLVVITAFKVTGRKLTQEGASVPEMINLIPPRYQGGFTLDVTPRTSRVDFPMRHDDPSARPHAEGPQPGALPEGEGENRPHLPPGERRGEGASGDVERRGNATASFQWIRDPKGARDTGIAT